MKLIDLMSAPPGNWKYYQPQTGFWVTAVTFLDLVRNVSVHRANNKIPIVSEGFQNLPAEIEDSICQSLDEKSRSENCEQPTRVIGPRAGDVFAFVIHQITGRGALTCGVCGQRMVQMNAWGWWGCWTRRATILGWMREEAAKRGHQVTDSGVENLFRAAWKEMRNRRKSLKASLGS